MSLIIKRGSLASFFENPVAKAFIFFIAFMGAIVEALVLGNGGKGSVRQQVATSRASRKSKEKYVAK